MSIKEQQKFNALQGSKEESSQLPFCGRCHEKRYVVSSGERFVHAELCPSCMSPCPTCNDRGFVLQNTRSGASIAAPCELCGPIRKRIERFNRARLPRRFQRATLDNFSEKTRGGDTLPNPAKFRFLQLSAKLKVGDRGAGLSGPVGVGKSHLLCALVRDLALERATERQLECRFVEFTHLLSDIRKGYDEGHGEGELIDDLAHVPILVIDELGKGLSTAWQVNILDELISRRYNLDVTTFFSTNYPFTEQAPKTTSRDLTEDFRRVTLEEKIGARMYSRLSEMCQFIHVSGEDYRRKSR